jgi:hypothetical protein
MRLLFGAIAPLLFAVGCDEFISYAIENATSEQLIVIQTVPTSSRVMAPGSRWSNQSATGGPSFKGSQGTKFIGIRHSGQVVFCKRMTWAELERAGVVRIEADVFDGCFEHIRYTRGP